MDDMIAGEDFNAGDLVTIGPDGKVYRLRRPDDKLWAVASRKMSKGGTVHVGDWIVSGNGVVTGVSKPIRRRTWLQRLWNRIKGT